MDTRFLPPLDPPTPHVPSLVTHHALKFHSVERSTWTGADALQARGACRACAIHSSKPTHGVRAWNPDTSKQDEALANRSKERSFQMWWEPCGGGRSSRSQKKRTRNQPRGGAAIYRTLNERIHARSPQLFIDFCPRSLPVSDSVVAQAGVLARSLGLACAVPLGAGRVEVGLCLPHS